MSKPNWKDVVELIGISAIVASLVFVGIQMALEQNVAESQAYIEAATLTSDQSALIAAHQEIWVAGLNGQELSEIDESIFQMLGHAAMQRKVAVWHRRNRLDAGDPDRWVQNFAYEIYIYPGLRRWWHEYVENRLASSELFDRSFSDTGFSEQVMGQLQIIDEKAPSPPPYMNYLLQ